jgi:hypothetical protein
MRDPLDIDQLVPLPMARGHALDRLAELLPPSAAVTAVWDEIIGPLYDARRFTAHWPRGRCRHCHVPHPGHPRGGRPHVMRCPKYVGALKHHRESTLDGPAFTSAMCTCGVLYLAEDGEGRPNLCPDRDIEWRGPRPDAVTQE